MNIPVIESYAKQIARSFNDRLLRKSVYKSAVTNVNAISSVQRIGLNSFVEKMGLWAMSNNTRKNVVTSPYYNVLYFIQECFPFDNIIPVEEEYTDNKIKIGE